RTRRERPGRRAAKCGQQFPPSDGDCHTHSRAKVRKENDTTTRGAVPNSRSPDIRSYPLAGKCPPSVERRSLAPPLSRFAPKICSLEPGPYEAQSQEAFILTRQGPDGVSNRS